MAGSREASRWRALPAAVALRAAWASASNRRRSGRCRVFRLVGRVAGHEAVAGGEHGYRVLGAPGQPQGGGHAAHGGGQPGFGAAGGAQVQRRDKGLSRCRWLAGDEGSGPTTSESVRS